MCLQSSPRNTTKVKKYHTYLAAGHDPAVFSFHVYLFYTRVLHRVRRVYPTLYQVCFQFEHIVNGLLQDILEF